MTKIALLSDTHSYLHPNLINYIDSVDEIWHAGDIGNIALADALEKQKKFRAVYGNIDGHEIRARYPEELNFTIEGVSVYITHIGGYPPNYTKSLKPKLKQLKPHLFICGHSHILKVIPDPKLNLLHLNPGACGQQGWHKVKTLMTFELKNGTVDQLNIIELN